jgi:hypothetical protein
LLTIGLAEGSAGEEEVSLGEGGGVPLPWRLASRSAFSFSSAASDVVFVVCVDKFIL